MLKITNKYSSKKTTEPLKSDIDTPIENTDKREKQPAPKEPENDKSTKIETCYFCLQKFDMNQDDLSHYKYGKFPMCDYCSQFYGFYD